MANTYDSVDTSNTKTALIVIFGAGAGVIFTILVFISARSWDEQQIQSRFSTITTIYHTLLRENLAIYIHNIQSLRYFFTASNYVDRKEFATFTDPILKRHPEIQALEWIPKVSYDELAKYINAAKQDGLIDYAITEKSASGELIPVNRRMNYFPVYYLEPIEGNEPALGYDLGSNPERLKALQLARDTGNAIVSSPIKLVQGGVNNLGVLIIIPVYDKRHIDQSLDQRAHLMGFVLGVFNIDTTIRSLLNHTKLSDLKIQIVDHTHSDNPQLVFSNTVAPLSPNSNNGTRRDRSANNALRHIADIKIANRIWTLILSPTDEFYKKHKSLWQSNVILVFGLLFTAFATIYVVHNYRRTNRFGKLVQDRAQQLHEKETRRKTIVETIADGIFTIDQQYNIESMNPAAGDIFGYKPQEIIGKSVNILIPDLMQHHNGGDKNGFFKTGNLKTSPHYQEINAIRKNGDLFPIEIAINEMRLGSTRLFNAIVRDITQRKFVEQSLKNNATSLERLHEVTARTELPFSDKVDRLLKLGLEIFSLDLAIVSRIENNVYKVEFIAGPESAPSPGTTFRLEGTYCIHTLNAKCPVAFHHVGNSEIKTHPCYKQFGLEAYIGTPIYVDGRCFGTLNFSSTKPRNHEFSNNEKSLIKLFAQWIGGEISRNTANEELHKQKTLFESLFREMPDPILIADSNQEIILTNPAFSDVFLYEPEEIYGKNTSVLYESLEEFQRQSHEDFDAADAAQRKPIEIYYRKKSGETFTAESVGTIITDGHGRQPVGYLCHIRDITERKLAEHRLNRYKNVLDNTLDMIFMFEPDNLNFVYLNKGAVESMGYSRTELLQMTPYAIKPDIPENEFRQFIKPLLSGELSSLSFETEHRRKNGEDFPVEIFLQLVKEDQYDTGLFVAIVHDITERKKLDRMKDEFVSTVSHELRTPLTSIHGSIGLVTGGIAGELPEKALSLLEIASKNSDRLILIINDLLDMEKIASGNMQFNLTPQALTPLINHSIESNQAYADQFKVTFTFKQPAREFYTQVDSDRLMQVMTNLLSNAAKFSPPGGNVHITLDCVGDKIRVAVIDQGPGISEEFHQQIFQKFSQADASDSRQKGGTGLGLSICKSIIEKMNGEIAFETEPGHGSTFYFLLDECESPCNNQEFNLQTG